jgi:hypothetical protein
MRVLRVLCCAAAIAAFVTPSARADEWNKQTYLTFSAPVQVPGATLPAGTYTFKLADLQGNRHVVQIFDKDGTKLYTTILAIPDERLEPTDKPLVMFTETPAGTPAAVKAWFYPGDRIGNEFVYPRREAMTIAKTTHQPVLSRADESSDMKTGEVARIDESGKVASQSANQSANVRPNAEQNKPAVTGATGTTSTTATGTTGTTAPTTAKQSTTAQPRASSQADRSAQNPQGTTSNPSSRSNGQLPKTASPLALYELVSGLALAGAYGVRRLRSRR